MITNENKKLAQWAMEFALKNGCQSSRVSLYNGSSSSFEIRDMKIDRLQQASENSLVIQLFVDGRFPPTVWTRRNWKSLSAMESTQPVIWQKTKPVHFLTHPFITKAVVQTCN